jgi:1-deoxy-D-xylulose-5-phosphate reductoisomerase
MERIDVVVHPQSVVHSMVEFVDGSTIAQASPPDMKLPIALGMSWPERTPNATQPCDWTTSTSWTFEPVDEETFPAIALAKRVGTLAGSAPAAMNAANEEAVDAFLSGEIEFLDIVEIVTAVVNRHLVDGFVGNDTLTLEAVELVIDWAKSQSRVLIEATAAQNR